MGVRILLVTLTAALLCVFQPARAQKPTKIPRITFLSTSVTRAGFERFNGIRQSLRKLGYEEGKNIVIEYRSGGANLDRHREVATEVVRSKPDIIVVGGGTQYIQLVKNATATIPIVMTGPGSNPVGAGLVKSLARPGGNVTGLTNLGRELGGKRLELLKEAVPKLARVAILYNPTNPAHASELREDLGPAARALKLILERSEVRASEEFEAAFAEMAKRRPDALYALGGPLDILNESAVISFALRNRLPSTHSRRQSVDGGGFMFYGADLRESSRSVARYIDKILKGAKPGDLPVERPTKFELVFNLKTAKQIGLTIPQRVLQRADRVIR